MDKYGEMGDSIYCYPDSDVLKNKLNIQDAEILQQAELELTEYASTRKIYAPQKQHERFIFISVICT